MFLFMFLTMLKSSTAFLYWGPSNLFLFFTIKSLTFAGNKHLGSSAVIVAGKIIVGFLPSILHIDLLHTDFVT